MPGRFIDEVSKWPVLLMALMTGWLATSSVRAEDTLPATILKGFQEIVEPKLYVARFELIGTPRSQLILLAHPDRVALDLFDTVSAIKLPAHDDNPMISDIRQGLVASDRFRIVFALKGHAIPRADLSTEGGKTILTLTVTASDAKSFAEALASQRIGQAAQPAAVPVVPPSAPARTFTVVLDPGHGGVDTGAKGKGGTLEKNINLDFAFALRNALKTDEHITVIMTRDDDRFISLSERSEMARRAKADLFVSMHADSIRFGDMRGATVYVLSDKASDTIALETAESENASDRFAGPEWKQAKPDVFDILVDLTRRETDSFSEHFAAGLVDELDRHSIRLIRNPRRSAGFRVLKAPDVPSVLIEMGYLSNADDEKLLADAKWRQDAADAIAAAVVRFLSSRDSVVKSDGG